MSEPMYVEGVCSGVEQRPGSDWVTFAISVAGRQYPVKLQTKLEDLIDRAKAVGSNHATWKYKERESENINPHTGKPYINRYLEDVRQGSATPEGYTARSTAGGNGKEDVDWDSKERRDFRSRAWGMTTSLFERSVTREELEDPAKRKALLEQMQAVQRFIYMDVCESFAFPDVDDDPNLPSGSGAEMPPRAPDDDIPF